jgi:FtsP/CotA-like multicopper oxidase with cupredoxin domain
VLVQDSYRTPAFEIWFQERATPPLAADSGLINGKNQNGSVGTYSEFNFTPGKKYRMRIINTSTDNHFQFSIDRHTMTVQAADFIAVQPYNQTVLSIGIGIIYF